MSDSLQKEQEINDKGNVQTQDNQAEPAQDPLGGVLGTLTADPQKLLTYLFFVLIGFLVASIVLYLNIADEHKYLMAGMIGLIVAFLGVLICFGQLVVAPAEDLKTD